MMATYPEMLDALKVEAEAALGLMATRDPSVIAGLVAAHGGCVFIGFPTGVTRLLDGVNLDVPVSLIAPAPGDLRAADWLLTYVDALVEFCRASAYSPRPIDVGDLTYPAVTVTARIAL